MSNARTDEQILYSRRLQGETLESIASDYTITRERVRQIIADYEAKYNRPSAHGIARERASRLERNREVIENKIEQFYEVFASELGRLVVSLSDLGLNEVQIEESMGLNRGIVSRFLIRARGLTKDTSKWVDGELVERWSEIAEAGATHDQAARQTGYTQGTVSTHLRQREIKQIQCKHGGGVRREPTGAIVKSKGETMQQVNIRCLVCMDIIGTAYDKKLITERNDHNV